MPRLPLLLAALVVLVVPATASARAWQVDDDLAQCPAAPFRSIQAAVDHAAPGDEVRVCAGTYREQVVVSTPRLRLKSVPRLAATIVRSETRMVDSLAASVLLRADRVRFEGFHLDGGSETPPCAHAAANGVGVSRGIGVRVAFNRFTGWGQCAADGAVALGVGVRDEPRVEVDRNEFRDNWMAVYVANGHPVIQRNTIVGHALGDPPAPGDDYSGIDSNAGDLVVRGNDFVDTNQSINIDGEADPSGRTPLVRGNRLTRSRFGILNQGRLPSRIIDNLIVDPYGGIEHNAVGGLVQGNRIVRPTGIGIRLSGPVSFRPERPVIVRDNVIVDALEWSCYDSSTGPFPGGLANRWARNLGTPSYRAPCG